MICLKGGAYVYFMVGFCCVDVGLLVCCHTLACPNCHLSCFNDMLVFCESCNN